MVALNLLTLVPLALASAVAGLNILLTNDDSWAAANIRYDNSKSRGSLDVGH